MGRIVGIDLGTTTSAITILKKGKPEIIASVEGHRIIDSIVAEDEIGEFVVGRIAKNYRDSSVKEIKSKMGTREKTKFITKELYPEEISAEILKKLKRDAEEYLGEEIKEAVITVPAMFQSNQKNATIKSGELAGLKVERIINEPTAAALFYGIENMHAEEKILVYDFGGGTFDVSILDFDDGILDVIGGSGDNHLGGKNIDEILMKYISASTGIKYKKGTREEDSIKDAAEQAKIDLSSMNYADIILPDFNIHFRISRDTFETLIKETVDKTFEYIKQSLKDAKLTIEDIDVVLPVGGTTRIPIIKNKLKEIFGNKVKFSMNPQEAVALGASVQAGIKSNEISSEEGIIITDICNYPLGVGCIGEHQGMLIPGVFSEIIPKHTSLPCYKSEIYYTVNDDQDSVNVEVYQGESKLVLDNIKIGEFTSPAIPRNRAGLESIKITFGYDLNGVLEVEAEIVSTGEKSKINYSMQNLNLSEQKVTSYKNSIYYSDYKTIIDMAEQKLEKVSAVNKQKIKSMLDDVKEALLDENKEKLDLLDDALTDFLFEV